MRRGRSWKKRARRTATASLPLWARIPRFYIWNNELERAKDAICERPLNLYVCRRGALWLAYHRTQTQSATQWEFLFNSSTDIDSYYSYDTRTRQKCFIRTGYSFQPSIRLNSSTYLCLVEEKEEELFICHIHNYTEYTQQWNLFSAFNPSESAHTWSSGQPTMRCPRSSWGFGALLKGLTSVVDNSCWSQDSNPQPRVTSPTLYPLGHDCPLLCCEYLQCVSLFGCVESMCSACVVVKLMKLHS